MSKKKYAFFDLDYTLIPHDTILLLCNYMIRRNPLRLYYLLFFLPIIPFAALKLAGSATLKRFFLSYLAGIEKEKLDFIAREFVKNEVIPRVYPELIREINRHKEEGALTVLNTASPSFYVKYIAGTLGFDEFRGTDIRMQNRFPLIPSFTGGNNKRIVKLHKMKDLLPESASEEISRSGMTARGPSPDYDKIRIPNSIAYTDSPADLPMLLLSEKGVLVHPQSNELHRLAGPMGWTTVLPRRPYSGKVDHIWMMIKQLLGLYR